VDEITTIDNALTRPWTVTKKYRRDPKATQPLLAETICAENNNHVVIARITIRQLRWHLMPTRKDQPPPDLKYFEATRSNIRDHATGRLPARSTCGGHDGD